jgi:hypothetical protein
MVWHHLKSIELDLTDKAIAQKIAEEKDISHRLQIRVTYSYYPQIYLPLFT